jgi:hypothetical protein
MIEVANRNCTITSVRHTIGDYNRPNENAVAGQTKLEDFRAAGITLRSGAESSAIQNGANLDLAPIVSDYPPCPRKLSIIPSRPAFPSPPRDERPAPWIVFEVPLTDAESRLRGPLAARTAADERRRDPAHFGRCGELYCRAAGRSAWGPLGPHRSTHLGSGGRTRSAASSNSPCFMIVSSISKRHHAET